MAADDEHFRLRIPPDLKAMVDAARKDSNRSMTGEINFRLRASLENDTELDARFAQLNEKLDRIIMMLEASPPPSDS